MLDCGVCLFLDLCLCTVLEAGGVGVCWIRGGCCDGGVEGVVGEMVVPGRCKDVAVVVLLAFVTVSDAAGELGGKGAALSGFRGKELKSARSSGCITDLLRIFL